MLVVFCSPCVFLLLGRVSPMKFVPKACVVGMPLYSVLHQILICIRQGFLLYSQFSLLCHVIHVCIIMEFGFFTSSGLGYENTFLPVVGDTGDEIFLYVVLGLYSLCPLFCLPILHVFWCLASFN